MQPTQSQPTPENSPTDNITFACQECGKRITFPYERLGHVETCPHCDEYVDVPRSPACPDPSALPLADEEDSCNPSRTNLPVTRELWLEILAVASLVVIPALFHTVALMAGTEPRSCAFVYQELSALIFALQCSLPLLAIMKLSGEPWAEFGIVRFSWFADIVAGVTIWICGWIVYFVILSLVPESVFAGKFGASSIVWARPEGALGMLLLLASSLANGVAEELVWRGFLLTRLERLLRSTSLSILLTTFLFAICHIYQGAAGVVVAAAVGLVYGTAFCCFQRRLWPVCIAHAIADFIPLMKA